MADDGSKQSAATWPLVKFQFSVKIGSDELFSRKLQVLHQKHR